MTDFPTRSLADLVFESAEQYPDRLAIRTMDDFVSYALFKDLIINYALHMRARGIGRSSCIGLDTDHPIIAMVAPLACCLLGCSWVHMTPGAGAAAQNLGVTHVVHDGTKHQTERRGMLRITQAWSAPPDARQPRERSAFPGFADSERTWMIAQSSGTTGQPKFMALNEGRIWPRINNPSPVPLSDAPCLSTLFHPLSVPGLSHIMRCLAVSGTTVFGYDLGFLRSSRVEFVSGSPNHYAALLRGARPGEHKMRLALSGGGPVRKTLVKTLLDHFEHVLVRYSSTEAGNICYDVVSDIAGHGDTLSPGKVIPPAALQVVDDKGAILPPMTEGTIRVRSPSLVRGYLGAPAESAQVFRNGWFHPGDTGYLSPTGELHITGRTADHLNIGGVKVNPQPIDEMIQAHPEVTEAACFAVTNVLGIDELAAAVVLAAHANPTQIAHTLHRTIRERFGSSRTPANFYVVDRIPQNQNGKYVRRDITEAVRNKTPIRVGQPAVPITSAKPSESVTERQPASRHQLADMIFAYAAKTPDAPALTVMGTTVTYANFKELITNSALHLRNVGIGQDARVAISIDNPAVGMALAFACSLVGCTWLLGLPAALRDDTLGITHHLSAGPPPEIDGIRSIQVDRNWAWPPKEMASQTEPDWPGYRSPDVPWMLARSSGTTGDYKYMPLTERLAYRRSIDIISSAMPRNPALLCLFPALSTPALNHTLRILARGGNCIFGNIIDEWASGRVNAVFGAPNHFASFLTEAPSFPNKIDLAIVGGAPARRPFFEQLLKYVSKIDYIYASTEAAVVSSHIIENAEHLGHAVSAGTPLKGVDIQIINDDSKPCGPGEEGTLRVRSPWRIPNYIGRPELNEQVFQGEWFYPGDRGYFTEQGELFTTGRVSDHLNIGGVKLSAERLDDFMLAFVGVTDAACFAMPTTLGISRLAAVLVPARAADGAETVRSLHQASLREFGLPRTPHEYYLLDAIPRNQNGKLARHELPDLVRHRQATKIDMV